MSKLRSLFIVGILAHAACRGANHAQTTPPPQPEPVPDTPVSIANPAATYCVDLGGTLETRDSEVGEVSYCLTEAGECEEWALYRGECPDMAPGAAPSPQAE